MKKFNLDGMYPEVHAAFLRRDDIILLPLEEQKKEWELQKTALKRFFNHPNMTVISVDTPEELEEITRGVDNVTDLTQLPYSKRTLN